MGTVLSSNSTSSTHGMTRTQFHQSSYPSSSHTGLTDLPEEYYIEHTSDFGPCDHTYFECVNTQRDYYLPLDGGDSAHSNAENGSLTRLNPLYSTHSSHSLGLKRIISGLNRKSRHLGKDSGSENGAGREEFRQRQSRELLTEPGPEGDSVRSTNSSTRGSRRRAEKSLNSNSKSSNSYVLKDPDSVAYENTRGIKCSNLTEDPSVARSSRSGSFNIPYRNGTPYGRPHELVKPTCNACRHLSISVNPPIQVRMKRAKARDGSGGTDGETQMMQSLHSHTRHVHFNQRRQLSEPGCFVRKRHSQYCEREHPNSSFITRSPPYPQSSPSMTDSRCFTNYALHPDTADLINNRSLEQLHIDRGSQVIEDGVIRSVPPRPAAPPSRQVLSKGSPATNAPEPNLNLSVTGSCSPVVYSCPYHLDFPPCSLPDNSVPALTHTAPQSLPHPAAIHRTHCSVQPSPSGPIPDRTKEDLLVGHCTHRRLTETPGVNPFQTEKPEQARSKSLTKSLSCYALKFFGAHHSYLRNRAGVKSDTNSSRIFAPTKQKNRLKHGSSSVSTNNNNNNSNSNNNTNNATTNDTNPRVEKQHNIRVTLDTEPDVEEQKTNANASVIVTSGSAAIGTSGVIQTANTTRDGSVVWCDAHKKPGKKSVAGCTDFLAKTSSIRSSHSDQTHSTDPTPSGLASHCDLTAIRSSEISRGPMFSSSYSHYTYKPDPADQWMNIEGSLPAAFSRLTTTHLDPRQQPILKAGTSELLRCLSFFVVARLQLSNLNSAKDLRVQNRLRCIPPSMIVGWIKAIDRALLLQGWSELAFINPPHVVFLFMLLKECLDYNISSERELHTVVMACLYLSYSYMGNEISYPLKPFLVAETNQLLIQNGELNRKLLEGESALMNGYESSIRTKVIDQVRNRFWQYCLRIINSKSAEMLQINADPIRFTELFAELRSYESLVVPLNLPMRMVNTPK